MRKNIDDTISIFNGVDGEFECTISNKTKKNLSCRCEKKIRNQRIENIPKSNRLKTGSVKSDLNENLYKKTPEGP